MGMAKRSLLVRARLFGGILRRLFLHAFRPGYVRGQLQARKGECLRCGACCQMAWRCTFFHEPDGRPACKFYSNYRYPNCVNYPIDDRDIADRNLVFPDRPCGYSWAPDGGPGQAGTLSCRRP
jgi:hypothetical protein